MLVDDLPISTFFSLEPDQSNICNDIFGKGAACAKEEAAWGYDTTSKQCKILSYRGCMGNENRYEKRSDCEQKHSKYCLFKIVT